MTRTTETTLRQAVDCRMRRIMAMGDDFACMMQDDDLICWGRNTNLILGDLTRGQSCMCIRRGVAALSGTRPIVVASNLPRVRRQSLTEVESATVVPMSGLCWVLVVLEVETWSFAKMPTKGEPHTRR